MRYFLGIEITKEQIKAAVVARTGLTPSVAACFSFSAASASDAEIGSRLCALIEKYGYRNSPAVLVLSRNCVTVRNLHLPSSEPAEISKMIELHISRIVPFKREEVFLSRNLSGVDELGYSRVTLAIIHDQAVRRYMRIAEQAGVSIDRVELSSYGVWAYTAAAARARFLQLDLCVILDIDAEFIDFIVADKRALLFTRSIAITSDEVHTESGIKRFLGEVRQSLMMFYNEEVNKKPGHMFVCGQIRADLKDMLAAELDIEVTLVAPLVAARNEVPPAVSMVAAARLAMESGARPCAFVVPELDIKKELRQKARDLLLAGSLVILCLAIICLGVWGRIYNQRMYADRLARTQEVLKKDVGGIAAYVPYIEVVDMLLNERNAPLFLLYTLQRIVPPAITLNAIELREGGKVTVRGQALELVHIFEFEAALKNVIHFKDVASRETKRQKINGKDVVLFDINFFLASGRAAQ